MPDHLQIYGQPEQSLPHHVKEGWRADQGPCRVCFGGHGRVWGWYFGWLVGGWRVYLCIFIRIYVDAIHNSSSQWIVLQWGQNWLPLYLNNPLTGRHVQLAAVLCPPHSPFTTDCGNLIDCWHTKHHCPCRGRELMQKPRWKMPLQYSMLVLHDLSIEKSTEWINICCHSG